jgi:hypothetical protein
MIEESRSGAGSGSVPLTNGSGSRSKMPKNIWIWISNIAKKYEKQDNCKLLDRKEKDRSERVRYPMVRARYQHQYAKAAIGVRDECYRSLIPYRNMVLFESQPWENFRLSVLPPLAAPIIPICKEQYWFNFSSAE